MMMKKKIAVTTTKNGLLLLLISRSQMTTSNKRVWSVTTMMIAFLKIVLYLSQPEEMVQKQLRNHRMTTLLLREGRAEKRMQCTAKLLPP